MEGRKANPEILEMAAREGFTPLQARILAARLTPDDVPQGLRAHVTPSLATLSHPGTLPDIDAAAERLADMVVDPNARCVLVTDHDVDGQTAHSVLRAALIDHFGVDSERVGAILSHKRKEGFGVSDAVVERIIDAYPPPALIVTADQGSQDEERFKRLREVGYEIIVTDHHHVDDPPPSALACVNPSRKDSKFPDPLICGCHVAWLLACHTRTVLINRGYLPADAPGLGGLLDYVGLASVADSVSIARSHNNRAVISAAIKLMNQGARPAWIAAREVMRKEGAFDAQDLAMGLGPRLNAISRMGEALPGVKFLRASDPQTAAHFAAKADAENQARKLVERGMTEEGRALGTPQAERGEHAICVYFKDGNSGVHGIVASRMVEQFGRPAVCLSPKDGHEGVLTGSLRSIPGVDVHAGLVRAKEIDPACIISFGGHSGAAGVAILEKDHEAFAAAFAAAIGEQRDLRDARPVLLHDGPLGAPPSMETLNEIEALAPFGREFEPPVFSGTFQVQQTRVVGDGTHLKLTLANEHGTHEAIWFRAMEQGAELPVAPGDSIEAWYELGRNVFKGRTRVDMKVRHARSASVVDATAQ